VHSTRLHMTVSRGGAVDALFSNVCDLGSIPGIGTSFYEMVMWSQGQTGGIFSRLFGFLPHK